MTMDVPLLEFKNVTKGFVDSDNRKILAIGDISLSIRQGEFLAIIGPSGCGKTTLLRLAAGLDTPSSGYVLYDGKPVTAPGPERGLVFQAYTAFPWLTVRENIAFGLSSYSEGQDDEQINRWLNKTGLTEFADHYPKALSGGMRQRMALARTMIVSPKVVFLDEPMGALDQRTREKMQLFLLEVILETNTTAVLVTHDIREAVLLSDRIVILGARPGRIAGEIESNLPKPRTHHQLATPEFELIYNGVVELLPE
mgnify:CR=1 FL=1